MRNKILIIVLAIAAAIAIGLGSAYHPGIPSEQIIAKYSLPESQWMDTAYGKVHYADQGTGPAIVLIHGTSSSIHTWNDWAESLSKSYRVIRLGLMGFGLTGPSKQGKYGIGDYVDFVHECMQTLGVDQFVLAGNSLGGLIAWRYALEYPQQVKALGLLNAAGLPREGEPLLILLGKAPILGDIMPYITPRWVVENQVRNVYAEPSRIKDGVVERYYEILLADGNRKAFQAYTRQARFSEQHERLNEIAVPTLVMWGEHDRLVPVADAHDFADRISDSTLVIYDDAGHIPMEEIPERSVKDFLVFLRGALVQPKAIKVEAKDAGQSE